jgi:hypothetical protein
MPPSRRATIGAVLTALSTPIAGCRAPGSPPDGGANGSPTSDGSPTSGGSDEGTLEVRLRGPETDRRLFDGADVESVGSVRNRGGSFGLPVTLADGATDDVAERFRAAGVPETPGEFEVVQFHDGEEVGRFGIAPGLAAEVADGEWNGELLLTFARREQATELREALVDSDE